MPSEIVDRVAIAIFKSRWDGQFVFENEGELMQELYRKQARAAIAAIIEPTDEAIACRARGFRGPALLQRGGRWHGAEATLTKKARKIG